MTDQDRLAEIRQRRAAIRPGLWFRSRDIASGDATVRMREGNRPVARVRSVDRSALVDDPDECAQVEAEFIAHAPDDVPWLVGEVERLRGLLRRLEWAGNRREEDTCPACYEYKHLKQDQIGPHADDCWLAAEL